MKKCINFIDRFKGLMFQNDIKEEYLFPKCKSIHTFFMKINIDVIAIDKKGKIIKIYKNITPYKVIIAPKDTYYILETKANSKYQVNDIIKELEI